MKKVSGLFLLLISLTLLYFLMVKKVQEPQHSRIAYADESVNSLINKAEEILNDKTTEEEVSDHLLRWAGVEVQNQNRIQGHLTSVDSKPTVRRMLFGPDYKALNELKREIALNKMRIQQLEDLKSTMVSSKDVGHLQSVINLMMQENDSLQEKIDQEEKNNGLFGWLIKLLIN